MNLKLIGLACAVVLCLTAASEEKKESKSWPR